MTIDKLLFEIKKFIPRKVFLFFQPAYHFLLSFWAALFYGFPSRKLMVIGVVGTKGKTTVVELLHKILGESSAYVVSFSSLRTKFGLNEIPNERKMTMPGRFFLQKLLREAVRKNAKFAILELTSEGIKQFRHRFIKFDILVMTNVSPEHIEAHGGFEEYLRAKLDPFWRLKKDKLAIINRDDPNFQRFSAATGAKKAFYSKKGLDFGDKTWNVRGLKLGDKGTEFEIDGQAIKSYLVGEFNFYNILAAIAVGTLQHIPLEKISAALSKILKIPGRLEFIQEKPFGVVVDYAHTPDSLRQVYEFLGKTSKKLICVLGSAGGGRDKWKRPAMGRIAAEFCHEVILTDEDPYDEDPREILNQIENGFLQSPKRKSSIAKKILDRREAIHEALDLARIGDAVIITGKGAERWIMGPNNTKTLWDDGVVAREELKKI